MKNEKDGTKKVKVTDGFEHFDVEEVNKEDLDPDSFKTIHAPNGAKIIFAKDTKKDQLVAVRIIRPKVKKK